ncbi:MAG: hypothetical protein IKJ56_02015 [Bacteroidales bacterium]|nr:hypothetical protein [Bacteroidales bacterium]
MLIIGCKITIVNEVARKKISFDIPSNIEVITTTGDLTDKAIVKVSPSMRKRDEFNTFVKRGCFIEIMAWYTQYNPQTLFKGYITRIETLKTPMEIHCENAMWLLKQVMVKPKIYAKFNLQQFVDEYCEGLKVVAPDGMEFGEVIVDRKMTMAAFLAGIKKNFGYFKPFFIDNNLHVVSRSYHKAEAKPITLDTTRNIISHDLKLTLAEDVKVSVTATTILPNNTKLEVKIPEGKEESTDNKSIYLPNISDLKTLREEAERYLKNLKSDRMTGTITTFGVPFVRKCDLVLIKDAEHPEITNRKFVVEAVTYTVGSGGYRQRIKLGDEIKQKQNL